jgi:hypothetical protein
MTKNTITKIFWAAGIFNIGGMLLFSLFFTNPYPEKYYPLVFSKFGMIAIILWGMAYISVSSAYMHARWLMLVFAIEKLVYVITWTVFLADKGHMIPEIINESFITGSVLSSYGAGDFAFGCFFAWVWIRGYKITE